MGITPIDVKMGRMETVMAVVVVRGRNKSNTRIEGEYTIIIGRT